MSTVIGIAFGNTNSSIAYEKDGKVEVIANPDGDRFIPSTVSYVGSDEYSGLEAKAQLVRNAANTVTNFRDYLGKSFANIDASAAKASAKPVDGGASVAYKLERGNGEEAVSVDEIAVRHLSKLQEAASDFIGKPIDGIVVAVPTDFDESTTAALVKACESAKLPVLQVISEPSAALLASDAANSDISSGDRVSLVLDLGGIRSDAAVIASRGGVYTTLATHHAFGLGGNKLDDALVHYFAKEFEKKHKLSPLDDKRGVAKLVYESEAVKKTLSNTSSATFAIESLAGGIDYHGTVNRLRFELVAKAIFAEFNTFAREAVKKAGLDPLDVDEVLLVGGTANVPKIAKLLDSSFENATVVAPAIESKAVEPAELVARGAAIQAALVADFDADEIKESTQAVVTVAPHTTAPIGVKLADGSLKVIIPQDTPLPVKKSVVLPAKGSFFAQIYEGKHSIDEKEVTPTNDDDDSDFDDEPYTERTKKVDSTHLLGELGLESISGDKVEVIVNITRELKLEISAREIGGAGVVRGVAGIAKLA